MPSLIAGPVKFLSVSSGSNVNFGDTGFIAPKLSTKSYSGSGSTVTGDFSSTFNGISNTNTADPDVIDSNVSSVT